MLTAFRKIGLFLNMVLNYGINPKTIMQNNKHFNSISGPERKEKNDPEE